MTKVNTKYLMNYIGGKSQLRKTIAELIPEDIQSYIEPFGGAAWVMLYKDKWANLEVYNDLDKNLYNLFNIIKFHPEAFIKEFRYMLNSRAVFNDALNSKPITDIQKAANFFFLLQRSYGAKKAQFATARNGAASSTKSQCNIIERVAQTAIRFDKVLVENLDFEELIKRYDIESAFFYCDPPYSEGEGYDVVKTKDFDHKRLFSVLSSIKGRFLLSYDDKPSVRELYKDFNIVEISRQNILSSKKGDYKELLIKNY